MGYARVPNGLGPFVIQFPTFANNNDLFSSLKVQNNNKKIIRITDLLGRECGSISNVSPMLHIYDDGSVEHKHIIK